MTAYQAQALRYQGALAVLRHVHAHPGVSRAEMARALELSSGSATEITTRLKADSLLAEDAPAPTGGRGRPSPRLVAHPHGPLACLVDIGYDRWRVAVAELGGRTTECASAPLQRRDPAAAISAVAAKTTAARRRFGGRIRAVSVAVAATVRGDRIVQGSSFGWRDVSLSPLRSRGLPLLVGNDATLAGMAEARRGAGAGVRRLLHIAVEAGVGGALVVDGMPVNDGEFGHLPFGDPARRCPCGAYGCWEREVTGAGAARALGRGLGGLVNALDPDAVTLSGPDLVGKELRSSYRSGLMRFYRKDPPPLIASSLGADGRLVGAAEVAFDNILTVEGIAHATVSDRLSR
ncbi:ROK family transcriptional regulator [Fodinicola acaciae]|uniref:ROK family transcriptional regulator n=1 Tax=Fodinicola acaciae TaxID=2681555 RepID=UPI0013D23176|nr:ROK family transcriptional regulator [Fodinicola acaciae]